VLPDVGTAARFNQSRTSAGTKRERGGSICTLCMRAS
jgi:hypothetical protein